MTHSHEECRNQVDTDLEASSLLAAFIMLKSNMQLAGERENKTILPTYEHCVVK